MESDHENTVSEQIQLTEIPAPPFQEEIRAQDFKKRLQRLGLKNVKMDKEGNVFGVRPGIGNGPKLFVSAHLDTV
ncbi:peptidase M20, partial [Staphylococcus sp. SIMBA_130]